jgi:lipoprotein-anchoring transpeptidase ErfK/SrfK
MQKRIRTEGRFGTAAVSRNAERREPGSARSLRRRQQVDVGLAGQADVDRDLSVGTQRQRVDTLEGAVMSNTKQIIRSAGVALVLAGATLWTTTTQAQLLATASDRNAGTVYRDTVSDEPQVATEMQARLRRQIVDYSTTESPGTIIGRDGFTWSGIKAIERKSEWPDWIPPADMLQRQPYLPRFMAGGPGNPLGARAMYLSGTVYRIHGTNAPHTIGKHVSSGCIRMVNEDVIDLYSRTHVGTKVVVLPMGQRHIAQTESLTPEAALTTASLFRASSLY